MSAMGTAVASTRRTTAASSAPPTPSTTLRKAVTENWDDDFEFSLPVAKGSKVSSTPKRDGLADRSNVAAASGSPDSFSDDWDDPQPEVPATASTIGSRTSDYVQPARPPGLSYLPRTSHGHAQDVPTPAIPSRRPPARQNAVPPPLSSASISSFRAAIAQEPLAGNCVSSFSTSSSHSERAHSPSKQLSSHSNSSRHPSPSRTEPRTPVAGSLQAERASHYPTSHVRCSSPSKTHRCTSRHEQADTNGRPVPKFWSRFSSGPSDSGKSRAADDSLHYAVASPDRRRARSSSVGVSVSSPFTDPDAPPVPSLPPNHRTSSSSSQLSSASTSSIAATPMSVRNSPAKRLSQMMRRSSSNLTSAFQSHRGSTPSPLPRSKQPYSMQYCAYSNGSSIGSTVLFANSAEASVDPAAARSDALPSTSDMSSTPPRRPSLPTPSGQESPDGLQVTTPTATRRSRPLSYQSHRIGQHSRQVDGLEGIKTQTEPPDLVRPSGGTTSFAPSDSLPPQPSVDLDSDKLLLRETHVPPSSPKNRRSFALGRPAATANSSHGAGEVNGGSITSSTHTTLTRIASFSKKHGRRLSGGWKFGTASSSSSADLKPEAKQDAHSNTPLEPVEGSPSKPLEPDEQQGSAGARPHPRNVTPSAWQFNASPGTSANLPDWQTPTVAQRQSRKECRRASLNDFVIPDRVLAAQKGLKRDKVALKEFAEGVQTLQALMESHEKVCNYILASGSQGETKLFSALEAEYGEWLEWASLLIEIGSTGTEGHGTAPDVRERRITLAAGDARRYSEALRNTSISSMVSTGTFSSLKSGSTECLPKDDPLKKPTNVDDSTAGRTDLSKRQLKMLQGVLDTPIEAGTASGGAQSQDATLTPISRVPTHTGQPRVSASPDDSTYDIPSPSYPSPTTANQLASQQPRRGMSGIRDFLRTLKGKPTTVRQSRPAPIDTGKATRYGHFSPPLSPLAGATSPSNMLCDTYQEHGKSEHKRRRPSVRRIFRHSSGNWGDVIRATPHTSPLIPTTSLPLSGGDSSGSSRESTLPRPALPRPPSIPAIARLNPKGYPGLGVESPAPSPTHSSFQPQQATGGIDLPPIPTSSSFGSNGDPSLRLKSRVRGLGHPTEGSPSRASSSPARVDNPSNLNLAVDEVPLRSRSDGAAQKGARLEITPDNLPGLLDRARECERMLSEWQIRAAALGSGL